MLDSRRARTLGLFLVLGAPPAAAEGQRVEEATSTSGASRNDSSRGSTPVATAGESESPTKAEATAAAIPSRIWLFGDDASLPPSKTALVGTKISYGTATNGAIRPFGSNLSGAGGAIELGAEVGLARHLSIAGSAISAGLGERVAAGMTFGLRGEVISKEHFRLTLGAGLLREPGAAFGAFARVTPTVEDGRFRASGTMHLEKVFVSNRDAIDAVFMLGASAQLAGPFRAGLEYVVQDVEGFFDDEEAEGGVRHFIGPTGSLELWKKRLTMSCGPGLGLTRTTRGLTARFALTMYLD